MEAGFKGWPIGDGVQSHRTGSRFTDLLRAARASGETVEKARWAEALQETYRGVRKKGAVEWRDGAPRSRTQRCKDELRLFEPVSTCFHGV